MFKKFFTYLIRFSGVIEGLGLLIFGLFKASQKDIKFLILAVLGGWWLYKQIKLLIQVHISRMRALQDSKNNRVVCIEGPQGRGKTSLMLCLSTWISDYNKSTILSNVPFKSKGEFVYKLDSSVVELKRKIPDKSVCCMDEVTLFYHNLDKINCYDFELLLQLERHFFDGNFFLASVKASRLPQQIKEKVGCCYYVVGQESKRSSLILGQLIQKIYRFFTSETLPIGYRCWTYQTFEEINHDNYNFDLSNSTQDTTTKLKHFSQLIEIVNFNDENMFEYNDRFMRALYDSLPQLELEKYDSLDFTFDNLNGSGYRKLIDYFANKYKNLK